MKDKQKIEKLAALLAQKITDSFEEVMDIEGLSMFLKMDKQTIYALTSARLIPYTKPKGKLLFLRSVILKWLDDHSVNPIDLQK